MDRAAPVVRKRQGARPRPARPAKNARGPVARSDRYSMAAVYCSFQQTDLRPILPKIKAEVLVLLESPFVNFQSLINEQYAGLPHARLTYAPKGLHFVMVDAEDWYFDNLHAFLKP